MSTNPHQLFMLADHVKLSLLERQRAKALNIEGSQQDGHITRSLETLNDGIEQLLHQVEEDETHGGDLTHDRQQLSDLQKQYTDLSQQFYGPNAPSIRDSTLTKPNNPSLAPDFAAAASRKPSSKSVRFRDSSPSVPYRDRDGDVQDEANRAALFPSSYTDEPAAPDQSGLDNQQIHAYHKQVLQQQDDQLDTLGQSIGRQRMLGIQMGDELDDQNIMLMDVEHGVDRFQTNLDRARGRLGKVARKAKDNWSWVTIAILIIILILLLAILK